MTTIERFKRDIAKHRGRAAVLCVLFITMVVFGVKAFFELNHPVAIAALPIPELKVATLSHPVINSAEAEERMKESKKLWHTLRDVKQDSAAAAVAFAFDPSYYPPPAVDPTKHVTLAPAIEAEPIRTAQPVVDLQALTARRIQDEARQLIIKTIAIGNGSTPSMVIVNQQLLTVGQTINGFELTAIRPRECEFVKEGVPTVRQMVSDQ